MPKETGFYVGHINSPFNDFHGEDIQKKCNGSIEFQYAVNNKDTSINNFHLLSFSKVPFYKNLSINQFQKEGLFCFIVK